MTTIKALKLANILYLYVCSLKNRINWQKLMPCLFGKQIGQLAIFLLADYNQYIMDGA